MSNVEKLPKPSSWWFAASHLQQNNGCCLITNSAVDFLVQQNLFWNQPICQCSTIRVFTGFTIHQIEFPCNIRKIKTNSHPGNSVLFRTLKAVLNRAIVFFLLSSRNKAIANSYYLLQKKRLLSASSKTKFPTLNNFRCHNLMWIPLSSEWYIATDWLHKY